MSDAPAAPVTENGVPPLAQEPVAETPEFKVFAGNLAYSTTDEGLKAFFAPVQSEIVSAQIIMRGHRSAGYGFVALSNAEAAEKAVEQLNKTELDGRQVIIEIAKPSDQKNQEKKERRTQRRPGRRGSKAVPGEVTEAEANGDAPKADDASEPAAAGARKIKRRKKKVSHKAKPKAEGEAEATISAPEAEGSTEAGAAPRSRSRKPRVQRPPRPAGEDPVGEPSKAVLFVANLGFNVDEDGLTALFTEAGINVVSARIVRRRYGRPRKSKGYGFVDVGDEEQQKKAIELLQDKEVSGRAIVVKIAVNTPQEEDGDDKPQAEEAAPALVA
jgi:RNA recognition motif-containing protein